ncbi:hypothetical protein HK101_000926, partial [Irineochytrium annulatum]
QQGGYQLGAFTTSIVNGISTVVGGAQSYVNPQNAQNYNQYQQPQYMYGNQVRPVMVAARPVAPMPMYGQQQPQGYGQPVPTMYRPPPQQQAYIQRPPQPVHANSVPTPSMHQPPAARSASSAPQSGLPQLCKVCLSS